MRWQTVPPGPLGGHDGDAIAGDAVRVAIVDELHRLSDTDLATIRAHAPDRMVGSALVPRSSARQWRQAVATLDALAPVWPVVGQAERRGDPDLKGFVRTFPEVGIPILSEPVPWYAVDVQTGDVRWRWVVCDSHNASLGSRWQDQWSWVPKAVSDGRVDRLVVALDATPEADELLDLVRTHASADELVLIVAFGASRPGLTTVGGRWGEGRLAPTPLPAGGWWLVDLAADGLVITAERPLGAPERHRWSPRQGWSRLP